MVFVCGQKIKTLKKLCFDKYPCTCEQGIKFMQWTHTSWLWKRCTANKLRLPDFSGWRYPDPRLQGVHPPVQVSNQQSSLHLVLQHHLLWPIQGEILSSLLPSHPSTRRQAWSFQTHLKASISLYNTGTCHCYYTLATPPHQPNIQNFQSGFQTHLSTEIAQPKVSNNLLLFSASGSLNILLPLDLSAAFDTTDHSTPLSRLQSRTGITGSALSWFRSYL